LVTSPKGAIKPVAAIVVLVGILILMISMSQPEHTGKIGELVTKNEIGDGTSKFISGALKTVLILAGLAALSFVVSEIRNLFK
jgi:hypothetical protein